MRLCDFQTAVGRMQRETKQLRDVWQQTKLSWRDKAAADFEEHYLDPMIPLLKLSLASIQELAEVMAEAERACGDNHGSSLGG